MAEYVKKEVLIDKLLHIAEDFERHGGLIDTAFAVATKSLIEIFEDEKCSIFEEKSLGSQAFCGVCNIEKSPLREN